MRRVDDIGMLSKLLLEKDILILFSSYSRKEQMSMLTGDNTAILSRLLLKEDIFRSFGYYLKSQRMSMLAVDNMAMLSRLLLKEDILRSFGFLKKCYWLSPETLITLASLLANVDPSKRPTARQALEHPWFLG